MTAADRTRGLIGSHLIEPELASWALSESHHPQPMIGRIGHPGDRTLRYAQGTIDFDLEIVTSSGARYQFVQDEAIAIALILATQIP